MARKPARKAPARPAVKRKSLSVTKAEIVRRPHAHPGFSLNRIAALVRRYWYLLRSSWPRILDLIYWPMLQMLMWGFLQSYLAQSGGPLARAGGTLIGALLLWDILFRGQLGFSFTFVEELYARNLGNLMMSPLRPLELVLALMMVSLIRLAIGVVPVSLAAIFFFGFNLWGFGLALAVFFLNLILTSWSIGIFVNGLLLRNGLGAEGLVWTFMFLLLPLTCVYYPVAVLPHWLQYVAWALPPTYVFEGMRALLTDHVFRSDLMLTAFIYNVVLFAIASIVFVRLMEGARIHGKLLQSSE
jgi:ABC-2 type transport system permease protein